MLLTNENLDELVGFNITDDSFFSEGTVILFDGVAWELVEICGDQMIFEPSNELAQGQENMNFFYDRAE